MHNALNIKIKDKALELGFDNCGIALASEASEIKETFNKWLENGMNGSLGYMAQNIDKRLNPQLLFQRAKSIIVCISNYYPTKLQTQNKYKIAKYALNPDYHDILKNKLFELLEYIKIHDKNAQGKACVDSAPIFEKYWAWKAGLGFVGKNSLLINPEIGSFCFIGILITNIEITPDNTTIEYKCADCNRCVKACPNGAIQNNRTINVCKCISYQTIEKGENDPEIKRNNWIYGCDICQDVCPYNQKPTPSKIFEANNKLINMQKVDFDSLTKEQFDETFAESSVKRIGYEKLMKNISISSKPLQNV